MKKHSFLWLFIWLCLFVLVLAAASNLMAQDRDTVYVLRHCPCDSAFVRRVNYRIERQIDANGIFMNSLKDHAQAHYVLEHRVDSLREVLHQWMLRSEEKSVPKPKHKRYHE